MRRIALFGGTFDPPHLGHSGAAAWVMRSGVVDELLVIPVYEHAFGKQPRLPFAQRVELCQIAFAQIQGVSVSAIEAELSKPNFTVHTVRALGARHPEASFRLVIGTDILADLPAWREGEELLCLAPPLVLARKGHPGAGAAADLPEISSSELRRDLAYFLETRSREAEARLRTWLDPRVFEHILASGAYAAPR